MSNPIHPSGTSAPSTACMGVSASNSLPGDEVDRELQLVAPRHQHARGGLDALLAQ